MAGEKKQQPLFKSARDAGLQGTVWYYDSPDNPFYVLRFGQSYKDKRLQAWRMNKLDISERKLKIFLKIIQETIEGFKRVKKEGRKA